MKCFLIIGLVMAAVMMGFGSGKVQAAEKALSQRQIAIIPIAAFTANGDTANLTKALAAGLENGLNINEIKEILIQMYAYTGFPRSLTGLGTFMNLLAERKKNGIDDPIGPEPRQIPKDGDRFAIGEKIQTELVGRPVAGPIYEFCPDIGAFLKEHLFCDIFARNILSNQDRELATVAALAALPAPAQLASHLRVCRNVGLSDSQLKEFARVLSEKVGKKDGDFANEQVEILIQNSK